MYLADPSAHVWNDGRLYVYPSHDIAPPRGCDLMDKYHVFSTDDMIHWKDHGEILNASQVPWAERKEVLCGLRIAPIKMESIIFIFHIPVILIGIIAGRLELRQVRVG